MNEAIVNPAQAATAAEPQPEISKRVLLIALIAFLGMIDTFYISIKHGGPPVACHVTNGCNDVLTSKYSTLAGIPISWFGLVFYFTVFSSAVFELTGSAKLIRLIFWPALAAFLVSLTLVGIQAFVLHKYCEYCLMSALFSTSIFLLRAA
jgi:uncharacterized membrane protein